MLKALSLSKELFLGFSLRKIFPAFPPSQKPPCHISALCARAQDQADTEEVEGSGLIHSSSSDTHRAPFDDTQWSSNTHHNDTLVHWSDTQ